jgi:hypothetical protein
MLVTAFSSVAPCVHAPGAQTRRSRSSRLICRDGSQGQSPSPINEDLIARLKIAEEEVRMNIIVVIATLIPYMPQCTQLIYVVSIN